MQYWKGDGNTPSKEIVRISFSILQPIDQLLIVMMRLSLGLFDGILSFVSEGWSGRVSDREQTTRCVILDLPVARIVPIHTTTTSGQSYKFTSKHQTHPIASHESIHVHPASKQHFIASQDYVQPTFKQQHFTASHDSVNPTSKQQHFTVSHNSVNPTSNQQHFTVSHNSVNPTSKQQHFTVSHDSVNPTSEQQHFTASHDSVNPTSKQQHFTASHDSVNPKS
ncbi:unnamed protein product [Mytilus coruscus]|uniref:Uncharacterized protein n=1 Tax=Mytilus coruscus TaxID=42192 RepID=A0A6J8CKX6_MYTCO|nr:unnamed protein product [Mytilus coruscus]